MNANANVGVNRANVANPANPANLNPANRSNLANLKELALLKKIAKSLRNIGAVDNASYKRGGVFRVRLIGAKADMKH